MKPLTQQLEDKKKEYKELYNSNHKNFPNSNICRTCVKMNRCQAEIAILEQAIAEMQKQRQEVLDKIDYILETEGWTNNDNHEHVIRTDRFRKLLKEKLNQPKTDK